MSKARLGKRERQLRKELWQSFKARRAEIIHSNMETIRTVAAKEAFPTSQGYAKVKPYEATMVHGLYRSGYDPNYSTIKDTKRGIHLPKPKSISPNKLGHGGKVRSLKDGTL